VCGSPDPRPACHPGPVTPISETGFRRLAQSTPWRFSRLHFTWRVGLDLETGIVVSAEPVGGSGHVVGFDVTIHEVR
jgi:hypothetical protein